MKIWGSRIITGVPILDEGSRTDSSDVDMVEGDDALSGAAGEVGQGAIVVEMVGRPTEMACVVIGALAAVVTWVLTMAREAIGEGWQLALAECQPWRIAWFDYSATLQTVLPFTIFRTHVSWSLGSVEVRDDA
jgi:hypothetical protein